MLDELPIYDTMRIMSDAKTEALTVVPKVDKRLVITKKEDAYIPKFKIKMADGSVRVVPQDAEANKNQSILLAETARDFITEQIKRITSHNRVLTPQEIKELILAAKLANEMSIVAHEDIMTPTDASGKRSQTQSGVLLRAVEAAAKGVTTGNIEAQAKALERFRELGKKDKKAQVIDVEAKVIT